MEDLAAGGSDRTVWSVVVGRSTMYEQEQFHKDQIQMIGIFKGWNENSKPFISKQSYWKITCLF
jgi:hypothetical protein